MGACAFMSCILLVSLAVLGTGVGMFFINNTTAHQFSIVVIVAGCLLSFASLTTTLAIFASTRSVAPQPQPPSAQCTAPPPIQQAPPIFITIVSAVPPGADGTCSICLEETKDQIARTRCNHYFHLKCISDWISVSQQHPDKLCPICNQQI